MDEECKRALEAYEESVNIVADLVRGNPDRNMRGLIEDMKVVNAFILKWEKREYAFKIIGALIGGNIIMTAVALITLLTG